MQNKVRAAIVVFVILTGMVLSFGKPHLAHATDMSDVFNISDGYIQQDGVYIDESPEVYSNGAKFKLRINLHGDSGTPKPAIDKQITGPLHGQFDSADTFNDWDSILDSDLEKSSSNGIFFIIAKKKVVNNTNTDFVLTDGANYTVMGLKPEEQPPLESTLVQRLVFGIQGNSQITQTAGQLADGMKSIRNIGGILWRIGDPTQYFFNVIKFAPILSVTGLEPDTTYYARVVLSEDNSSNIFTTKQIVEFKTKPAGDPIGTAETSGSVGTPESETEKSGITYGGLDIFCVRFDGLSFQVSPAGCVAMLFQEALVPLSSLIANATGHLFDAFAAVSLGSTIYGQGQSGHKIALFVENSWSIVRDIANIFFIFILLYAALGLVLSLHHFDAKKLVAQTIIIALIINFSLFFCRVTVDASNILSRVFYNAMSISATGNYQTTIQKEVSEQPISAAITGSIQPQKLLGPESLGKVKNVTVASIIMILLLVFVLNLVLAWIFFMCAAFFAGRIGVIWFSMIFAPLAFVSSIVPSLDKNLKQLGWHNWLSGFMKACFNAPIFFFFLYMITNLVGNGDGGLLQTTVAAVTSAGNGGLTNWITFLVAILLPAMIVVGLLIAAKGIAEEMAGQFGAAFAGIVAAGTGLVAMGVTGGAAVGMSKAAGFVGNKLQNSERFQKMATNGNMFTKAIGLNAVRLGKTMQTSSFDVRQTGLGNAISKATGVNMNTGSGLLKAASFGRFEFSTAETAGGREGREAREKEQLEKDSKLFGKNSGAINAINEERDFLEEGDPRAKKKDKNGNEVDVPEVEAMSAGALKERVKKDKEEIEDLDGKIASMKGSMTPDQLANNSAYQNLLNKRENIRKDARVYQNETTRREERKTKLETLEKQAENDGPNRFLLSRMKTSGYEVHGTKTEKIYGPSGKQYEIITKLGHVDFNAPNVRQKWKNAGAALGKDLLRAAAVTAGGFVFGGPAGAVVAGTYAFAGFGATGVTGGLAALLTKDSEARGIDAATHHHGDDKGHGHGRGFKDGYNGPSNNFLSGLFSTPKGGGHDDHGSGGHDNHSHGH